MSRSTRRQAASHVLASRLVDLLSIAGAAFALDAASKWLILNVVMQPPRAIPLLPVLDLTLGFNTGVSFGLFRDTLDDWASAFSAFKLLVAASLIAWALRTPQPLERAGLALIAGGAIGNAVDRWRDGMVTDFIDLHWAGHHFPTFNLADVAITLGVGCVLLGASARPPSRDHAPI
ncbi:MULTISPECIES: signal peptidase II [Phreatobacteraceae]|uniref:signal peptidase II n=1 Tax=Phreatobacteraceae TaxID=2843305 RepID=UPI0026015548|nr:signal peptidase II [Phreatobacter sp.]